MIKQTYIIHVPVEDVWKALTSVSEIERWGASPAKMEPKKGKFSLWGGEIWGENKIVIKNKKLVQDWWSETDKWDKPTKVTFLLSKEGDDTKLELIHEGVPEESVKDIDEGWHDFYLGPLKEYLESKN